MAKASGFMKHLGFFLHNCKQQLADNQDVNNQNAVLKIRISYSDGLVEQ